MEATIYTYTVVRSATAAFSGKVPYLVAILDVDDGRRLAAFVEGYRDGIPVAVGDKVVYTGEDVCGNPVFALLS